VKIRFDLSIHILDVRRLLADIKDVNRQIESDLHRLQNIAKFAQTASSILDGLAKLAAGLAALA